MTRRVAREKAVQALYQIDMRGITADEALEAVKEENTDPNDQLFMRGLVDGVLENQENIDQAIRKYLRGWSFDRLALVDRAVLRIATFEIMHMDEVPDKVSLNEAIELARSFGMEESVKFINAVLANIVQEKENHRVNASE